MGRVKMPQRRVTAVFEITHELGRQPLTATIGFDSEGAPREVFLDVPKSSPMGEIARDSALLISIALQSGVPLSEMQAGVGRDDESGKPHTIIGTALDLLAKVVAE